RGRRSRRAAGRVAAPAAHSAGGHRARSHARHAGAGVRLPRRVRRLLLRELEAPVGGVARGVGTPMRLGSRLALGALALILAITMAWWALALWPLPAGAPAWLLLTRAACFGAAPGGLPDTYGWMTLVGEPAMMLGMLYVLWGDLVAAGLRALWRAAAGPAPPARGAARYRRRRPRSGAASTVRRRPSISWTNTGAGSPSRGSAGAR